MDFRTTHGSDYRSVINIVVLLDKDRSFVAERKTKNVELGIRVGGLSHMSTGRNIIVSSSK